jgi:hypothetical protein
VTVRSSALKTLTLLAVLPFCSVGCHSPSVAQTAQTDVQAVYDKQSGRLRQLTYDSNKNGKTDGIGYMDGTRILRIELDKDEDGKVERWEYYGADQKLEKVGISGANDGAVDHWAYRAADGTLLKMEISTKRNGKVQRTEVYEKDALVRVEEDTDENGVVDKWETYSGGTLTSVAFDTEGKGLPVKRLVYSRDGVIRIETPAQSLLSQR